ncbi:hypothetical protein [Oceanobacillus sp. FSL H7-0719]|uniref:hypothetical protein n=1 Tax=Oceanobacillus sp. FSL H7-0719 TaxID=2954507 RepID=UPI00324E50B9
MIKEREYLLDYQMQCSRCQTYFMNSNGLETFNNGQGVYKGCPACETDEHIVNLK